MAISAQVIGDSRRLDRRGSAAVRHLRAGGVSVVIDTRGTRLPRIGYWGPALPATEPVANLILGGAAARTSNTPDEVPDHGVLPEHSAGWMGTPGLAGHRSGRSWSSSFRTTSVVADGDDAAGGVLTVLAGDDDAQLEFRVTFVLTPEGVLKLDSELTNVGESPYVVDQLALAVPVPGTATELLDLTGRHLRERSPQRQPFNLGVRTRESRRGRTGLDASLFMIAGTAGFGFQTGEAWAVHLGWSGNHRLYAERMSTGERVLGAGELLLPGEVILQPGESYGTPAVYAVYGRGLDDLSARLHQHLRARPAHPTSLRPVILNTWEAVYFRHDLPKLTALADAAAEVGAERFVLDDGWFRGRRDDSAGLGDWFVDDAVWPRGLHTLVDHVRSRGMQFGLWVEPEMINPDSELARAHPDWIISTGHRLPPLTRHQQVLDLTNPAAYAYILGRLNDLVGDYAIDYLKWDHNRDLVDAGHQPGGEPVVHAQTSAVYRLLEEVRAAHPYLEIESCASGGGRVDLGILQHTDRVWASDCNDALERQQIQRWTELLLPPELIGAHVGPAPSHSTGRSHSLDFRAGTALFGHFGMELDLTQLDAKERDRLAEWIGLYKKYRPLLHTGRVIRADQNDPTHLLHGVVAQDQSEALMCVVQLTSSMTAPQPRVQIPGLDPETLYRVTPVMWVPPHHTPGFPQTPWLTSEGVTMSGAALAQAGVRAPDLSPEQLMLLHLQSTRKAG